MFLFIFIYYYLLHIYTSENISELTKQINNLNHIIFDFLICYIIFFTYYYLLRIYT